MALATGAAIVAGAAYLNGKYQIAKDLDVVFVQRRVAKETEQRVKDKTLPFWYQFEESARRLKNETCLWYREKPSDPVVTYTWTETYDHACRYAQFYLQQGVQPGELVGNYLQNSPEFIFNILGSWAIGCAPAEINYNLAGDGLVHCLEVSQSKLLVVDADDGCRSRVEEVRNRIEELGMRIIVLDAGTQSEISSIPPTRPSDEMRLVVNLESPVALFYTSGTTGLPKAVPFTVARAMMLGKTRLHMMGLKAGPNGDTFYNCMPLYHGTAGTAAMACMMVGQTLAIGRRFSTRAFWADIHDSQATVFVYVGETARYLLNAPPSALDTGHRLQLMYGNGLRPDVWTKFQQRFAVPRVSEFFNSSEGVFSLVNRCDGPYHAAHVGHHGALLRTLTHNIFVPVAIDHAAESSDQIWRDPVTGFARRMPYDEGGEILVAVQSEKDFAGYWRNPKATAKRFERDVFRKGDLFYRTGDALRRDSDGKWHFLDRLGDTFRWKSENVSTAEVAEVLGRFPGCQEANVYGVAVPGHEGRAGCAAIFIPPTERERFDFPAFLTFARKNLPKPAVPVFVRCVDQPTPMHNNKQNKVPLRNEGVDLDKISTGTAGPKDVMYWARPSDSSYAPFRQADWKRLVGGQVRL